MADKKKQHYVPKFLLRQFSNDDDRKLINVFNVNTKFYRANCPLKDQGQESYFYGADGKIENILEQLENSAAPIIADIQKKLILPKWGTSENRLLFMFSLMMSFRTINASETTNEFIDKTFQEIKKLDSRFSDEKYKNIHMGIREPAAYTFATIGKDIFKAYDLELILLHNKTNTKFILSDDPSIKYNQFLEQRNHPGGHTGLFSKGLQVFFPISPELMLVYFDKWAYKFGYKKNKVVEITDPIDIEQLNILQMVNCTKIIYSSKHTTEHYLTELSNKAVKLRQSDRTELKEINKRQIDEDGNENIYYLHHNIERKIKMRLSFIKQPQHAKSHNMSDYFVQVRDEKMRSEILG